MLNESMLFRGLRRELGEDIFDALDPDWILDILNEKTILQFSILYPYIVRGVEIKQEHGIPSRHPQSGAIATYKYKIPNETPDLGIIGIENFYFAQNFGNDRYTGLAPLATDTMIGKLRSYLPTPQIRRSARFEPPDIVVVDPIPIYHQDFSIDVQRVRRLNEFPLYYYEFIEELFYLDVKWAIYNKYKNARDNVTLGGVEVQTFISDYSSARDDRKELMDKFNKDYYKNPERFASFMQFDA